MTLGVEAPKDQAHTPASVVRRLGAFGVDYLVIAAYILTLWLAATAISALGLEPDAAFAKPVRAQLLGFALLTVPVVLYFALWEASAWKATPGKRALGLEVVSAQGGRLPWPRSLLRSAIKFLPWELAHASLWRIPGWPGAVETIPVGAAAVIGLVWLLIAAYLVVPLANHARQTPYDRAARALVTDPSGRAATDRRGPTGGGQ